MSIGNMPEDELDDLFRKAASEYNPEFDPEAWRAMEKKLGPPKPSPPKWWRLGGLIALILLIGIGTWFGYQALPETAKNANSYKAQPAAGISETTRLAAKGSATPNKTTNTGEIPKTDSFIKQGKTNINQGKTKNTVENITQNSITESSEVKLLADNLINTNQSQNPVRPVFKNNAVADENNTDGKRNKTGQTVGNRIDKPTTETAGITTLDSMGTTAPVTAAGPTNLVATNNPTAPDSSQIVAGKALTDSVEVIEKKSLFMLSRFTFSLAAAPDLTSVGFANLGGISTNAGVLVGYNLSEKWRVTTGIIGARKIYQALPGDYGNEYEFWKNRHKPDDIEAVCRVLDIPVNLGYQVWQQGRNNLIINTGLSSYLMRREKYTYEYYPYGSNNGYTSNWQVKNQNKHLFSIYNLSVGYGRELTRGVLVGVEPFIKIPLAGVGAGKIKLASAGVFGSLSFRFTQ